MKTSHWIVAATGACLLAVLLASPAEADDVGITTARLIEHGDGSYVLEADIALSLRWTIKQPIFPDRFEVSELTYVVQAGQIIVQATATTSGEPLGEGDKILLPWSRNGVSLTIQFADGTVRKGLFLRGLEGITVPVALLLDEDAGRIQVLRESAERALAHVASFWVHILLALAIVAAGPNRSGLMRVGYLSLGAGLSLILADLGLLGPEPLYTEALGFLVVILAASSAITGRGDRQINLILVVFGVLHGLSYAEELTHLRLPPEDRLPALYAYNGIIELTHWFVGLIGLFVLRPRRASALRRVVPYVSGVLSVAILINLFVNNVRSGDIEIFAPAGEVIAADFALPGGESVQGAPLRPRGTESLNTPVMAFLTIEPGEVRQEVLIRARTAIRLLGIDNQHKATIPIASQDEVKGAILELLLDQQTLTVDGLMLEPTVSRVDFVSLSAAGVVIKPEPEVESLDEGIIGLSLVFVVTGLPDRAALDWNLFPVDPPLVELSAIDPFGVSMATLSESEPTFEWESRLQGFRVPVIEEVAVEQPSLPLVSALLFLAGAVVFWRRRASSAAIALLVAGFVLYPFARVSASLPVVSSVAPSSERASAVLEELLTNVYRAFDVRSEEAVYDRLEKTVIGDKLADIYLENRRALELEERGGARAKVESVDILDVSDIRSAEGGGFIVDARWLVAGSVSHFGHTHYRRNQYHALVSMVPVNGVWKISDIELIDEQRLL